MGLSSLLYDAMSSELALFIPATYCRLMLGDERLSLRVISFLHDFHQMTADKTKLVRSLGVLESSQFPIDRRLGSRRFFFSPEGKVIS